MYPEQTPVGRCPDCDASIPTGGVLVEYQSARGPAMFAECPDCAAVVHPSTADGDGADGPAEPSYGP